MKSTTAELHNICVKYSRRNAPILHNCSIQFSAGFTALVGTNGAGKTTLLKVLASLLEPQSGYVSINGLQYCKKNHGAYRSLLAWMPQDIPIISHLTVRESVMYHGWLAKQPRSEVEHNIDTILHEVNLTNVAQLKTSELSGGQRRRLGVAQALIRKAQWLILDEPTASLDPLQKASFIQLLIQLRSRINCIISTHDFEYFGELFDNVAILRAGTAIWQGNCNDFYAKYSETVEYSHERIAYGKLY